MKTRPRKDLPLSYTCDAQLAMPTTVKEEIFVGEKFRTLGMTKDSKESKTKSKNRRSKGIMPQAKQVEENLVWKLILYFFQIYESYEIKFPTKISSFTVFTLHVAEKSGKSAYAVNELSSIAFRLFGAGHAALTQFALVMNMPKPPSKKCVSQHVENAMHAAEAEARTSLAEAASEVEEREITVSFDGLWSQRGYAAAYGFGSAISISSGKVMDYHLTCKVCSAASVQMTTFFILFCYLKERES